MSKFVHPEVVAMRYPVQISEEAYAAVKRELHPACPSYDEIEINLLVREVAGHGRLPHSATSRFLDRITVRCSQIAEFSKREWLCRWVCRIADPFSPKLFGMTHEREDAHEAEGNDERGQDESDAHEGFVLLVINSQNRLYAYILSLVLDRERARDILQQTNLVLLEKESGFTHGTDFFAWAARVAYYEVLADRRRRVRDRHLFSDELLAAVASESLKVVGALEERADALRHCLSKLSTKNRDLLMKRYRPNGSVADIARSLGKTPGAVSAMLHRLRAGLVDCVERKLRSQSR